MHVAIVALNASSLFETSSVQRIGGSETFAWNLARALAQDNADRVSFIVRSERKTASLVQDSVHVHFVVEPARQLRHRISSWRFTKQSPNLFRNKGSWSSC
jgi:hypothetical protein